MLNKQIWYFVLMVNFIPTYCLDLITGGNSSYAYLEKFSYSQFQWEKLEIITAEGEEHFEGQNDDLGKQFQRAIIRVLNENKDIQSNNRVMITLSINVKHGSKIARTYRFNKNGAAKISISIYGRDSYGREVFYIQEVASLSHSVFGGNSSEVFFKSLKQTKKNLTALLIKQRENNNKAQSSHSFIKSNHLPKRQIGRPINSGYVYKKNKPEKLPTRFVEKKALPQKTHLLDTTSARDLINVGLGVGGLSFFGAEYKWRINPKVGAFLGASIWGTSFGGMYYFKNETFSNYVNIGIDTFMLQEFIGLKIQYGDYFLVRDKGAFSYEIGLYNILKDNLLESDSTSEEEADATLFIAASLGYAF